MRHLCTAGSLVFMLLATPAWALCTGSDDTVVLNGMVQAGGRVTLPAGICRVDSLNATNLVGAVIQGQGPSRTILMPTGRVWAAVVDLTGSSFVTLRDLSIGNQYQGSIPIAPAGILLSQRAGDLSSNRLILDNVQVAGCWSGWALYNYGVPSSVIQNSAFWNYCMGAGTVTFTSGNIWGVTSIYQTVRTDVQYAADWRISGTEIHSDLVSGGVSQPAFVCAGCSSIRLIGDTLAGSGPALIWGQSAQGVEPSTIYTYGTLGYSDNGVPFGAFSAGVPVENH